MGEIYIGTGSFFGGYAGKSNHVWERWNINRTYDYSTTQYTLTTSPIYLLDSNSYILINYNTNKSFTFNSSSGLFTIDSDNTGNIAAYSTTTNVRIKYSSADMYAVTSASEDNKSSYKMVSCNYYPSATALTRRYFDNLGRFYVAGYSVDDVATVYESHLLSEEKGLIKYEDVVSDNPNAYPSNGPQGEYWYVYKNVPGETWYGNIKKVYIGSDTMLAPHDELCFISRSNNSTVSMAVNGTPTLNQNFQYSVNGRDWSVFTPGTTTIALENIGDKVYFRGNNPNGVNESSSVYYNFVMTGGVAAFGNIMSLIDNGSCSTTSIPRSYCFYKLFANCDVMQTSPKLTATNLTSYCYSNIFNGCRALQASQQLPAMIMAEHCYEYMFYDCSNLTIAPLLPSTILAESCYDHMFSRCYLLTDMPALPATKLASSCYKYMFLQCTSLVNVAALPALELENYCYSYMFYGCSSLTIAPELPATVLAPHCYGYMFASCHALVTPPPSISVQKIPEYGCEYMFYFCTALTRAPSLPADYISTYGYVGMFYYCSALVYVPLLPATQIYDYGYIYMFNGCTSLQVSDTQTIEAPYTWNIPSSGVLINSYIGGNTFVNCAGTRASDELSITAGQSCIYYTQNQSIQ